MQLGENPRIGNRMKVFLDDERATPDGWVRALVGRLFETADYPGD